MAHAFNQHAGYMQRDKDQDQRGKAAVDFLHVWVAVRSSSLAPFPVTSVSGSGENSDGSSNGTTLDLVMAAYPFLREELTVREYRHDLGPASVHTINFRL
ncbi:hypothetical protein ABIE69_003502 [Rhodobacteraceae bacterium MBR-64]